jgi:hypothetical protein
MQRDGIPLPCSDVTQLHGPANFIQKMLMFLECLADYQLLNEDTLPQNTKIKPENIHVT